MINHCKLILRFMSFRDKFLSKSRLSSFSLKITFVASRKCARYCFFENWWSSENANARTKRRIFSSFDVNSIDSRILWKFLKISLVELQMFWRDLVDDVNFFKSTLRNVRSNVISMKMCTMFSFVRLNVFASSSRSIFVLLRKKNLASTFKIVLRLKSHSIRILLKKKRKKWKKKKTRRRKSRKKKIEKEKKVKTTKLTMMTKKTTTLMFESCRSLSTSSLKFRFLSSSTNDRFVSSKNK